MEGQGEKPRDSLLVDEWDDWVEGDDQQNLTKCLFSNRIFPSPQQYWIHAAKEYGLDIVKLKKEWHMTTYDHIKLVNYLRSSAQVPSFDVRKVVASLTNVSNAPWRDDQNLRPVVPDDPLLSCADVDDDDDKSWSDDDDVLAPHVLDGKQNQLKKEDSNLSKEELLVKLERTKNLLLEAQMVLAQKEDTILGLRKITQTYFLGEEAEKSISEKEISAIHSHIKAHDIAAEADYFFSYAHFGIHQEMLNDSIRTDSYRNFILNNPNLFQGKVVLDVGCGTGILSMFASQAGASTVIAVDNSEIIDVAEKNAQENNFKNIRFIKSKVELIENFGDIKSVDIIISEWMGYCLLFECMLPSVLVARDRWCGPSGLVFPDVASMILCGWYDEDYYQKKIGYWENVYGFKMSAVKQQVWTEPHTETIPRSAVVTDTCTFKTFDINKVKIEELDFAAPFSLRISEKAQKMHGFACYFDIQFVKNCAQSVSFSTGPFTKDTHWHQTLLLIRTNFGISRGCIVWYDYVQKKRAPQKC